MCRFEGLALCDSLPIAILRVLDHLFASIEKDRLRKQDAKESGPWGQSSSFYLFVTEHLRFAGGEFAQVAIVVSTHLHVEHFGLGDLRVRN